MSDRPPRLRPLPGDVIANNTPEPVGIPDAELYERLAEALELLPDSERAAALVAIGMDAGVDGVAIEQNLSPKDADALTRSALQLLRAAMADVDLDSDEGVPRMLRRRRRTGSPRPGAGLDERPS